MCVCENIARGYQPVPFGGENMKRDHEKINTGICEKVKKGRENRILTGKMYRKGQKRKKTVRED